MKYLAIIAALSLSGCALGTYQAALVTVSAIGTVYCAGVTDQGRAAVQGKLNVPELINCGAE